jgi:hypothetical protein
MSAPIPHHLATGIHPGAYVQDTEPDTSLAQDGVLWVDTGIGPPYALKCWDATAALWRAVGAASGGILTDDCLTFPHGATICNDAADVIQVNTPNGAYAMDTTGITLPGGHRLEAV